MRTKIPKHPKAYKPTQVLGPKSKQYKKPLIYETKDGPINVWLWARFPSYDFIFGSPSKTHKLYGREAGFFQFRDTRVQKVNAGFYVDEKELEILIDGFRMTANRCILNNSSKLRRC